MLNAVDFVLVKFEMLTQLFSTYEISIIYSPPQAVRPKTKDMKTIYLQETRMLDGIVHRYNLKINEEQNLRFERMLSEAGLEYYHN